MLVAEIQTDNAETQRGRFPNSERQAWGISWREVIYLIGSGAFM